MNYRRITRQAWLALSFETVLKRRIYAWTPYRLVKTFGEPELRPYYDVPAIFGEYVFLSDSGEVWTIYDRGSDHLRHGEEISEPERFWANDQLHYLHIGGPETAKEDDFLWWVTHRVDGHPHPELEMHGSDQPAITYESVARYRSKRDAKACYAVARLYSDMKDGDWAFCSVDYLKEELERYVAMADSSDDFTVAELELIAACQQAAYNAVEFIIVQRS